MIYRVGSARSSEKGTANGLKGDQKGGREVSEQDFYVHKLGWHVMRPLSADVARRLSAAMIIACDNKHLGYGQNDRYDVVRRGVATTINSNCDCSSLVRACCKYAGFDPGDFTTANECTALYHTGKFKGPFNYVPGMKLYTGDILVTKKKGHTVLVTYGEARNNTYTRYTGKSVSIVMALKAVGVSDTSYAHRKKIAAANGITNYRGYASQNLKMLELLKRGELIRA